MRVGLTYDLKSDYLAEGYSEEEAAEFDLPDTIEAIEAALCELGETTERIGNARALIGELQAGRRWDLVFNICEGMYGLGRESLVPALLDAWQIPYTFSDPAVLGLSLHKGLAKRVARDLGVPTPDFAVVETLADLAEVDLPFPLFAKPVAEGTSKGISGASKIESAAGLEAVCRELLEKFRQPVLVETYLPGREFTVGIVGTGRSAEALGAMEVLLQAGAESEAYSFSNKKKYEIMVRYRALDGPLLERCRELALKVWRGFGCRDAGRVDVRLDAAGEPSFVEVNPLAGLHPVHSDLPLLCTHIGIPFLELMRRIMDSARQRCRA